MIKTQLEIEELKRHWESDPIWDIYETEGFESHRDELRAYQEQMQAQWAADCEAEVQQRAQELGCTPALVLYIERLERRIVGIEARHNAEDR